MRNTDQVQQDGGPSGHECGGGGHDGHDHSHIPQISDSNEKTMLLALSITFVFMLVEAVGGWISGSLALIADAGHMLTDSMALALAYAAFRFGKRAADSRRTFGYLRFEVIAGLINAVTLFAIVIWIAIEAIDRFRNPGEILAGPMLLVAGLGLLINCLVFWILSRGDKDHVNIQGALLHVMGDLLGSVGAIAAAIIIYYTNWTPIDPILSVFVSLLILRSAWALMKNSVHILLEGAPNNATPVLIESHLMETVPDLAAVSHIHVWSITSGRTLATLDITPVSDETAREVSQAVKLELETKFNIEHATVGIEWPDSSPIICPLQPLSRLV